MKTLVKFECPGCGQHMESEVQGDGKTDLIDEKITCPDCGLVFEIPFAPALLKPISAPPLRKPVFEDKLPTPQQNRNFQRADKIRFRAHVFEGGAYCCIFLSICIAVKSFCNFVALEESATGFIWAGVCIVIALALYLIAQIVHIRANTQPNEKQT